MADEGAAGLDTMALEVAIHALEARDEPDRLWVEARAELAALLAEAQRATALAAALKPFAEVGGTIPSTAGDDEGWPAAVGALRRARGLLAGTGRAAAMDVTNPGWRAADAGPGAAGARDEAAGLYAALDGVLATCEWVRDEGIGVGVQLGLLRRLRRALDAPRGGGGDS